MKSTAKSVGEKKLIDVPTSKAKLLPITMLHKSNIRKPGDLERSEGTEKTVKQRGCISDGSTEISRLEEFTGIQHNGEKANRSTQEHSLPASLQANTQVLGHLRKVTPGVSRAGVMVTKTVVGNAQDSLQ